MQEAHISTTASYTVPDCVTPVDPSTALQVTCRPDQGGALTFVPPNSNAVNRNAITCSCTAGQGRDAAPVTFYITLEVRGWRRETDACTHARTHALCVWYIVHVHVCMLSVC